MPVVVSEQHTNRLSTTELEAFNLEKFWVGILKQSYLSLEKVELCQIDADKPRGSRPTNVFECANRKLGEFLKKSHFETSGGKT